MKVSDRNEVVIEGVVRRNRSLSGDAAAELDIQIQSRRRRSRGRKANWQHNRFDVRMSGPKAKAKRSRVRRGCIVRVSGQLRSTDLPDSKPYIEAEEIDVLRQPASKRDGRGKRSKAKGDAPSFAVSIPDHLLRDRSDEKPPPPGGASTASESSDERARPDEGAADTAPPAGEERAAATGPGTALVLRTSG